MLIKLGEMEWHDLRRMTTIPRTEECPHKRLQYMEHGELLLCLDCQKQVSAMWALKYFFTQYEREKERLEMDKATLKEETEKQVVHRAALKVQEGWRRLKYIPTCPHCWMPINPPDGFGGGMANKELHGHMALPMVLRPNLELVKKEEK